jgi:3-oxoadipate enol-lactonase
MEVKMDKLNIDGANIAFIRRGKGSPLVLLHGYPLDHTIWDGVVPLLEKEFDLIIPDMRGFGKSDVNASDDNLTNYATDMAKLLNHLKIGKAGLAGHSMGGYVALAFAREFPDRVSGLAMISSQTLSDTPEIRESRLSTARQVMEKGVGIVVEAMTPKLSTDERVQDFVKRLIAHQRPEGISNALKAMAGRTDSSELFPTFKFPVVIVHGDADLLIPIKRAREMRAALPTAYYIELAGLGHMAMMEKPDDVTKALTSLSQ